MTRVDMITALAGRDSSESRGSVSVTPRLPIRVDPSPGSDHAVTRRSPDSEKDEDGLGQARSDFTIGPGVSENRTRRFEVHGPSESDGPRRRVRVTRSPGLGRVCG